MVRRTQRPKGQKVIEIMSRECKGEPLALCVQASIDELVARKALKVCTCPVNANSLCYVVNQEGNDAFRKKASEYINTFLSSLCAKLEGSPANDADLIGNFVDGQQNLTLLELVVGVDDLGDEFGALRLRSTDIHRYVEVNLLGHYATEFVERRVSTPAGLPQSMI